MAKNFNLQHTNIINAKNCKAVPISVGIRMSVPTRVSRCGQSLGPMEEAQLNAHYLHTSRIYVKSKSCGFIKIGSEPRDAV